MSPEEAMKIAKERGVDLIEIAPNAEPPVCKLMDFGKWRYEQQKRDRQAKATQHKQLMKELRFHPGTDTHDFDFKLRHARTWLEEGHKVKATVQFKGREIAYKEFGEKLLRKLEEALTDISKVDQPISTTGKLMTMVFGPQGKGPKKPAKGDGESDAPKEAKPSEFAELLVKKISSSDLAVPVPEASGSDSEDAL